MHDNNIYYKLINKFGRWAKPTIRLHKKRFDIAKNFIKLLQYMCNKMMANKPKQCIKNSKLMKVAK